MLNWPGRTWAILIASAGSVVLALVLLWIFSDGGLLGLLHISDKQTAQKDTPPKPSPSRAIAVKTTPVRRGDLDHRIGLTGDIEAEASVRVYSKVLGLLEELVIERGDRVPAGQFLGRIEWREVAARVDQAKGLVARYRAQYAQLEAGARPEELAQARDRLRKSKVTLDHAKRTLERTKELVAREFLPAQELDNVTSAYQTALVEYNIAQDNLTLVQKGAREEDRQAAKAQLAEAEATLRLAQVQLGYTTLVAPIAGVIAERLVDRGAFVTLSTPVVTIVAMDRVKIHGRVSERDLGTLNVGQRAEIRVDAYPNEVFHGTLAQISPTVDRETRTFQIEIVLDNPEHRLKPGMFSHVSLIVEEYRNVLLIPKVALLKDGTGEKIFVVNGQSAHARAVKTGFMTDDWALVLDHLSEGEGVIVAGQEHLKDGSPIMVIPDTGSSEGDRR